MSGEVFTSIQEDLVIIHNNIKNQLSIKAGHISNYAHLEFSPMDNILRPAIVLGVARLYNCKATEVIALGSIVQFIFMASQIHKRIPESSTVANLADPRDGNQFPVLVGDYLYGKFFTTLCDANIVKYLRPLSEIIGKIHEGGILSLMNPTSLSNSEEATQLVEKIIRLETAELCAGAARLAGDLAGASEEEQQGLYDFGLNIGMVHGFLQRKCFSKQSLKYSQQAVEALENLPCQLTKGVLEHLVHAVSLKDAGIRKVV